MIYEERAAKLRKRRGGSPLLIGDPAASSTTINNYTHSIWITITFAVFVGATLCIAGVLLGGYGYHLSPGEARLVEQARRQGIDFGPMSDVEIAARLTLPPDAVASTRSVLRLPEEFPPEMRWASGQVNEKGDGPPLPSRIEALRAVTTYIASAAPNEQGRILDGLRVDAALTERAKSIVDALRSARPTDDAAIVHLIPELLRLPPDQLRSLEQAGFPPIPRDADRQAIYRQLPTIGARAATFLWGFVSGSAAYQQAVMSISDTLRWRTVDRALGALRDADPATVAAINALPPTCSASAPSSCVRPPQ